MIRVVGGWKLVARGVPPSAALCLCLAGCGGISEQAQPSATRIYASSSTATPVPTPSVASAAPTAAATQPPPRPTPTLGPVAYTIDFGAERRDDVTLHVGQALHLLVSSGPVSDWFSGVDDARVLRPMSPDGNGVYQAAAPGTALLTAHVLQGCARVGSSVPCTNPEHGLWFQTRVYVVP